MLRPSLRRTRFFFIFAALVLTAFFFSPFALAQSQPHIRKAPPPPPPPPAEDQQQFISYWTTETGWRTELQLRNNQVAQILTVTPILRAADGSETPLFPIVVQPQEVKTVDIETAIGSSAPQLIGVYGSLALTYRTPSQSNLYAVAMVMGVGHSVAFHIDATGEDQAQNTGSREGIWWLPNGTANDYLVLTNHGANPLPTNLAVSDASGKASTQTITLAPRAMSRISIRQILAAAKLSGSYGGIKISAASHAGSLNSLHVLFDPNGGFSAVMKMFDYDPRAQLKERDYAGTGKWTLRAPMLALSNPDPSLAFPIGTVLQPQLFIRNITAKPVDATLAFSWRNDANTGKAPGPALHLSPYETRRIDVAALQDGQTLPPDARWTSVILTTNSLPNEVLAVAASYDQTLKYGAQTPFSDQLAFHWVGSEWQYDPLHNSIITVGNGGTRPTQAAFTIFYNQGAEKYELEQSLQPGEQMWMDMGKLIRESVPDKNGKTLPADLTSGSYEIRDLRDHAIGTLFEGKVIYDKTYGHVTYGCGSCCGYKLGRLWYNPLAVDFLGTSDDGLDGLDTCSGQYDDLSGDAYGNWSSSDTTIATVDYYGTHTGQSVGSTYSSTFATQVSLRSLKTVCPIGNLGGSGGVNVTPSVSFSAIPSVAVGQTATTNATLTPSNNSQPISLSISSAAAVVSPTGSFTGNTAVTVKGLTVGPATLTATVPNPDGGNPIVAGSANFPVVPTISQNRALWFFGTGVSTPSGFTLGATSATLTATAVTTGTFQWTITAGTSKMTLNNGQTSVTNTNVNTVTINSTSYSTATNDVTVQLLYTPSGGSQMPGINWSLTIDSPYKLVSTGMTINKGISAAGTCDQNYTSGTDGYLSAVPYQILSFTGLTITNAPVNELFDSPTNPTNNNWPANEALSWTSASGTFSDYICSAGQSGALSPQPQVPQSPLGGTLVRYLTQFWSVGALQTGFGVEVQSDTLNMYLDHGTHSAMKSPVR